MGTTAVSRRPKVAGSCRSMCSQTVDSTVVFRPKYHTFGKSLVGLYEGTTYTLKIAS